MIYPCEVIDFRRILKNEEIDANIVTVLFSSQFSNKYLKQYPIFLLINTDQLDDFVTYGGIKLYVSPLYLQDKIIRIIINEPVDKKVFDSINKIIEEENKLIESHVSNSIPGVSPCNPKLSSVRNKKENHMNWYIKTSQTLPIMMDVNKQEEVAERGPHKAILPYHKGMKVRDRRKGIALPQEYGVITDIQNNQMTIEWHNSKREKEVYDLDDTVTLSFIIAEV